MLRHYDSMLFLHYYEGTLLMLLTGHVMCADTLHTVFALRTLWTARPALTDVSQSLLVKLQFLIFLQTYPVHPETQAVRDGVGTAWTGGQAETHDDITVTNRRDGLRLKRWGLPHSQQLPFSDQTLADLEIQVFCAFLQYWVRCGSQELKWHSGTAACAAFKDACPHRRGRTFQDQSSWIIWYLSSVGNLFALMKRSA